MRAQDNNQPLLVLALALVISILVTFQIYIFNEPGRITYVLASDHALAYDEGQALFAKNCVVCHGKNGEGNVGPALNSRALLSTVSDVTLFSLISSGVPGTAMPAWNQAHGGPLTDEQVRQLVTFIRDWETAETQAPAQAVTLSTPSAGDSARGQTIFQSKCVACHGSNGEGKVGPALNDQTKLSQLDDEWYRMVISEGRPAKGMPTWGTVLSPQDIADLVAFIRQWEDDK